MSELIEINEDNCVLSENEMMVLDDMFGFSKNHIKSMGMPNVITNIDIMWLKIMKLNDMAKEQER